MQLRYISSAGAALALLWLAPAAARSPVTTCEDLELRAAGVYAVCLTRAARHANATGREVSERDIARCDERFDRLVARAEAFGACHTPGAPATLRNPVRWQLEDTLATVTDSGACPNSITYDESAKTYTCRLDGGSRYAIDLAEIVEQIGSKDVTTDSIVWIEGWGGGGGAGNTSNGGSGGTAGYAQMTATPEDLESEFGSTVVYYYLGNTGVAGTNTGGGGGGAASLVTTNDLTQSSPDVAKTLIVAPGGGGRGKLNSCSTKYVWGGDGGIGGVAISVTGSNKYGRGADGAEKRSQKNFGGGGGGNEDGIGGTGGGGNAEPGADGIAPIGGNSTRFKNVGNTSATASGGVGGTPGDGAGGGSGGGGYGSGGGGEEGESHDDCTAGAGGGGGALARASTQSCARSRPSGLNGVVQIVFDAGNCTSSGGGGGDGTPVVKAVSPNTVTVGQTFEISGSNFTNATAVLIGAKALDTADWKFVSDSEIDVTAPSNSMIPFGTPLPVQVENANGKSDDLQDVTINAGEPTVTSVSKSPVIVGETFTINGTNFIDPTAVRIGGTAIDPCLWSLVSGGEIDVTTPALPGLYGDPVAVEVDTKYGNSNSTVNVVINQN